LFLQRCLSVGSFDHAGKRQAPHSCPLTEAAKRLGLVGLPISIAHGEAAGELPPHHADPFDRLLVAQTRIEGLVLVSRDRRLQRYEVSVLLV
jgi:PIN domain nuclease of toxin-antitoxin system